MIIHQQLQCTASTKSSLRDSLLLQLRAINQRCLSNGGGFALKDGNKECKSMHQRSVGWIKCNDCTAAEADDASQAMRATFLKSICRSGSVPGCRWLLRWIFLVLGVHHAIALKHSFHTVDSKSPIGPVGVPFGFMEGGVYQLTVSNFEMAANQDRSNQDAVIGDPDDLLQQVEAGFFLQKFRNEASFTHFFNVLKYNGTVCSFAYFRDDGHVEHQHDGLPLQQDDVLTQEDDEFFNPNSVHDYASADHGLLLSMKSRKTWKPSTASISYTFQRGEQGLYFLIYQVCPYSSDIRSSFDLDFHFHNVDRRGHASYLSAGEAPLPDIFFFFSISYLICAVTWISHLQAIRKGQPGNFPTKRRQRQQFAPATTPKIYPIHRLMSILLVLKFLSVFFESIRYHFICLTGHAEAWSLLYYILSFCKGTFTFTVLLLIGSGWSFVKPFLNGREKQVVLIVLILQVINNVAIVAISQETKGEVGFDRWTAILHFVDILCCCAVLIPVVWNVNALEKSVNVDRESMNGMPSEEEQQAGNRQDVVADNNLQDMDSTEKGQIVEKLKRFRTFYALVIAYIYSTRILISLLATVLSYEWIWIRYAVVELVTVVFYVVVGMLFRPVVEGGGYQRVGGDDHEDLPSEMELVSHYGSNANRQGE